MKSIRLRGKTERFAIVDDADYDRIVAAGPWHAHVHRNTAYALRNKKSGRKPAYMHQLVLGGPGIDHIDGDGLNNRRENLRFATHSENQRNRRADRGSTSPYKGVSRHRNKWVARIAISDGRNTYLGVFVDEEQAARAYDQLAAKHFGEFARLNFPTPTEKE